MDLPESERTELETYLETQYRGIFPPGQLERHQEDYVGLAIAEEQVAFVAAVLPPGARVLDVGCGFGTFVLAARKAGFDAHGIDVAAFEVAFAQRRLAQAFPEGAPAEVYRVGDGQALPYEPGSFQAVTLWNVVEHVPDDRQLIQECRRMLAPGGALFVVCPNYMAFREEAHYHVPWLPLLPRGLASRYLRLLGRDPRFFEADIYYRTNRGVLALLEDEGLAVHDPLAEKLLVPERIKSPKIKAAVGLLARLRLLGLARLAFTLRFRNPFKHSVWLYARKAG